MKCRQRVPPGRTVPPPGAALTLNAPIEPSGAPIDTSTPGTKSFVGNATDNAGNPSSKTVTYTVGSTFGGVLQSVNADGSSIFELGSTVPVKFQMFDAAGAPAPNAIAWLRFAKINGTVVGSEVEVVSTASATPDSNFRDDTTSQQYIFNLATKGFTVGSYRLTIHSVYDGKDYSVTISVR